MCVNGTSLVYFKNLASAAGGKVTLTAQWTPITYTIVYNKNGGSGSDIANATKTYGTNLTLNDGKGLSKAGYTFKGWNENSSAASSAAYTTLTKDLSTTNGASVTLYAIWGANSCTIKYNANGGSGTMTETSCTFDISTTLRANTFTRGGYTFKGWATAAAGGLSGLYSGATYTKTSDNTCIAGDSTIKNLLTSGEITLYAQWTVNPSKITFKPNSGSINGKSADVVVSYTIETATFTLDQKAVATRYGYNMAGWVVSNATAGSGWSNDSTMNYNALITKGSFYGNVTLTAKWTPKTSTVTLNPNGGSMSASNGWTAGSNGTYTKSMTYGSNYGTLLTPTRGGYTFAGWQGNMVKNYRPNLTNVTGYPFYIATMDVEFESNTSYVAIARVKRAAGAANSGIGLWSNGGYESWGILATNGEWQTLVWRHTVGDVTKYTESKIQLCAYDYPSSQSTPVSLEYFAIFKLEDVTGVEFSGYAGTPTIDSEFGSLITSTTKVGADENITLYARWVPTTYTITYSNLNGGTNNTSAPIIYNTQGYASASADVALSADGKLLDATKTGYNFEGWKVLSVEGQKSGTVGGWTIGNTYAANTTFTGKYGNIELKAEFVAKSGIGYSIRFRQQNADGSWNTSNISKDGTTGAQVTLASAKAAVTVPNGFKYNAARYYIGGSTTGTALTSDTSYATIQGDGSLIIELDYIPQNYLITFNADGGNAISNWYYNIYGKQGTSESSMPNSSATLPSTSKTGYNFSGWTVLSIEGTKTDGYTYGNWKVGTPYGNGTALKDHYGKIELKAIWSARTDIKLTLNANGGHFLDGGADVSGDRRTKTQNVTFNERYDAQGALTTPTRAGYTFKGWYENVAYASASNTIEAGTSGNMYTTLV